MANKKTARRAFVSSVISLILCCSMLVGTTFAWFTDEVTTGMNTIAAGNLDVELLADGNKVDSATKLFDDVTLWEPGVVLYENLQVANVGTLALKYRLSLNFGNENDLNGHKLSEVLKIAVIDKVADNATREEVLEAAKAALADLPEGSGTLANFTELGELEAGETGTEKTFVIFWEPNANEIDNLYNANNGQVTSDGKELHIEFGVKLEATQKMSEEDSFGPDYDEPANFLPKAIVNNTGAKTVPVMTGYSESEIALDTSFQFLPNETAAEGAASEYAFWNADYVVVADDVVPAESMALAGYYEAFCGNNGWVVLSSANDIAADTEIRLVKDALGVPVNYTEICQYAEGTDGFLCGVADLTGANKGTTITVELRLYETYTADEAYELFGDHSTNYEKADYEANPEDYIKVIGRYTYTFGGSWTNLEDGTALFTENDGTVQLVSVADVATADYTVSANVTKLNSGVFAGNAGITSVTIPASVTDFGASGVSATGASSGAFKGSSVESVVLENGLTEIPAAAFNGAANLTSVTIPASVTSIGVNAFRSTALTELTIPATITDIGYGAFRDMDSLTTVTIEGDNVTLPGYVFRDCSALRTVYLEMNTLTLNGSMNFANASSNNPGTNDITFYTKNVDVAEAVKAHMGTGSKVVIYVDGALYAEIN